MPQPSRNPPRRRPGRITRAAYTHCLACGKLAFSSRRNAKRAARIMFPHDRMSAYRCRYPDGQGWHFGHSSWRLWLHDRADAA